MLISANEGFESIHIVHRQAEINEIVSMPNATARKLLLTLLNEAVRGVKQTVRKCNDRNELTISCITRLTEHKFWFDSSTDRDAVWDFLRACYGEN